MLDFFGVGPKIKNNTKYTKKTVEFVHVVSLSGLFNYFV